MPSVFATNRDFLSYFWHSPYGQALVHTLPQLVRSIHDRDTQRSEDRCRQSYTVFRDVSSSVLCVQHEFPDIGILLNIWAVSPFSTNRSQRTSNNKTIQSAYPLKPLAVYGRTLRCRQFPSRHCYARDTGSNIRGGKLVTMWLPPH